jgi:hypothetical protein
LYNKKIFFTFALRKSFFSKYLDKAFPKEKSKLTP